MTAQRFASISSSILARKGEAQPWHEPEKKSLAWRPDMRNPEQVFPNFSRSADLWAREPAPAAKPPKVRSTEPPHYKKCTLRLTPEEYEQWGIMAVKKGTTLQHLLHQTMAQSFSAMAKDYGQCACLKSCGSTACCGNDTLDT